MDAPTSTKTNSASNGNPSGVIVGTGGPTVITVPRSALIVAAAGGLAIVVLLALVLVVLMDTHNRSVSLDKKSTKLIRQLSTVLGATEPALHAVDPTLKALPQTPSAARRAASAASQLTSETHQFLVQLQTAGLPASLSSLTKLPTALIPLISLVDTVQEQHQVPSLLSGLSQLSDSVNHDGLVNSASALFNQAPDIASTLDELRGLVTQIRTSRVIPVAVNALHQLPALRKLLARSLQVQVASLSATRDTESAAKPIAPTISMILSIVQQILPHVASLDSKVGVVP